MISKKLEGNLKENIMDNEEVVKSLKRMESLLEAIDWKLWTFHQKFMVQTKSESVASNNDVELDTLMSKDSASESKTKLSDKYPSVEKWS